MAVACECCSVVLLLLLGWGVDCGGGGVNVGGGVGLLMYCRTLLLRSASLESILCNSVSVVCVVLTSVCVVGGIVLVTGEALARLTVVVGVALALVALVAMLSIYVFVKPVVTFSLSTGLDNTSCTTPSTSVLA